MQKDTQAEATAATTVTVNQASAAWTKWKDVTLFVLAIIGFIGAPTGYIINQRDVNMLQDQEISQLQQASSKQGAKADALTESDRASSERLARIEQQFVNTNSMIERILDKLEK